MVSLTSVRDFVTFDRMGSKEESTQHLSCFKRKTLQAFLVC